MSDDHPLGLRRETKKTRIRKVAPRQESRPAGAVSQGAVSGSGRPSGNPFLAAFGNILDFIPELARASAPSDPDSLRLTLFRKIQDASDRALEFGLDGHDAAEGAWYVAALADDVAINTPWGQQSSWPHNNIVFMLEERGGGDTGTKFFKKLDELKRFPDKDPNLLELTYVCLKLGFKGMHRQPGGHMSSQLMQLVDDTGRDVARFRDREAPLSARWKGADMPDQTRRTLVPIWVLGLVAAVLLVLIHAGLGMLLTRSATGVEEIARLVPPLKRAELIRTLGPTETVDVVDVNTEAQEILLLQEFVERTAETGAVIDVERSTDDPLATRLILQTDNPELFRSGKATINDEYDPFFRQLANLIVEYDILIAKVTVVGHTDSIPVQASNPFASNQKLSEARADTVRDLLLAENLPENFVTAEGKGHYEPLDTNETAAGRARNRRVEILLQKTLAK